MAIRTYKVTLDTKNSIAPEPVFLRQGDKTGAVVIDATLMDNGAPVSLEGLTPMFKANTADGQAVIADSTGFNIVNASGGEFTYQVPNALSSVPGKIATAYFSFSDSSGSESTFDVAFIIKKAVDITKPQADDYIMIIDGTIKTLQEKIDAMNTDVQTILNAYNQGNFYNKTESDEKYSSKTEADTTFLKVTDTTVVKTTGDQSIAGTKDFTDLIKMFGKSLVDLIVPIGVILPTSTPENPSTLYPGTTWERYAKGRTLVGVDEDDAVIATADTAGGSVNPLSEHTHNQAQGGSLTTTNIVSGDGIVGKSNTSKVSTAGNNTNHANWQPFQTVYFWRRTA